VYTIMRRPIGGMSAENEFYDSFDCDHSAIEQLLTALRHADKEWWYFYKEGSEEQLTTEIRPRFW
jgi:hypothetical protein